MQQELTLLDTVSHFYHNFLKPNSNKSLEYNKCITKIESLRQRVAQIGMNFPDVSCIDFGVQKNVWNDLPEDVSEGVSVMGLHLEQNYNSVLVHFTKNAYLKPHLHSKEYEVIKVLEGSFFDLTTKQIFEQGDVFIIPKGQVHEIVTRGEECYMYILFSEDSKHLHLFQKEQRLARELIPEKKVK